MQRLENDSTHQPNDLFIVSTSQGGHWSSIINRRGQTLGHLVLPERRIIVDVPLFVSPPQTLAFEDTEEELVDHYEVSFLTGQYPKWKDAGYRLESCEDISAVSDQVVIAVRLEASYNDAGELMELIRFADQQI